MRTNQQKRTKTKVLCSTLCIAHLKDASLFYPLDSLFGAQTYKEGSLFFSRLFSSSREEKQGRHTLKKALQIETQPNSTDKPRRPLPYTNRSRSFTKSLRNVLMRNGAKCRMQTMVCKAAAYQDLENKVEKRIPLPLFR